MSIEFSESQGSDRQVHLVLPEGKIGEGEGWELVPFVEPTVVSDKNYRYTATLVLSRVVHMSVLYVNIWLSHSYIQKSVYTSALLLSIM